MNHLLFEEILLLSVRERAARKIVLHRTSTVVRGANDTGKSSLIKSLYWVLGAEPHRMHEKWLAAEVIAALTFTVNGDRYRMVRSGNRFALFDEDDGLIGTYASVTNELAPVLADLLDFHLTLRSKSSGIDEQATPAFLFLPFYLDQDRGWAEKLESFGRLQQFRSYKKDVLDFHLGVRPSSYYLAKSRKSEAEAHALPIREERLVVGALLEKFRKKAGLGSFDTDLDVFRDTVDVLLRKGEELREEQEKQKQRMNDAFDRAATAKEQAELTRATLADLRADLTFSSSLDGGSVSCPMCHAEYSNGFAERFEIAVDEDRCVELLRELGGEVERAELDYKKAMVASDAARSAEAEVAGLLRARHEKLKLQDLINSESRKETGRLLGSELDLLDTRLAELALVSAAAEGEMKQFDDRKRKKEILENWRRELRGMARELDVRTLPESFFRSPDAACKETGSDQPRALLAFYFSIVRVIASSSACCMCPLVIDSPNQQDQDDSSYARIRSVINEHRPPGAQLVLALADDGGTDFGGSVVVLTEKHSLLLPEQYEEVRGEVMPLFEISIGLA